MGTPVLRETSIYVTRAISHRQMEGERWRLLVHLMKTLFIVGRGAVYKTQMIAEGIKSRAK